MVVSDGASAKFELECMIGGQAVRKQPLPMLANSILTAPAPAVCVCVMGGGARRG